MLLRVKSKRGQYAGGFLLLCLLAYVFAMAALNRAGPDSKTDTGDFASYYYATQAAVSGDNPYLTEIIARLALEDSPSTPGTVHPYFYPPPFLLGMLWSQSLDLQTSYRIFVCFNALCLLIFLLIVAVRFPSYMMAVGSGIVLLSYTPVFDSLGIGQVNLFVLLLLGGGLVAVETNRSRSGDILGGLLLGLACLIKMSPAIIIVWWLVRKKWLAVGAASTVAVICSLIVLPVVGLEYQWFFYRHVLPEFFTLSYHGLTVPLNLPMNHSLLNFWMQVTDAFSGMSLTSEPSKAAVILFRVSAAVSLGFLLYLFRDMPADRLVRLNAAGAFVVFMVLCAPYTFEHHLVFLIFPLMCTFLAWRETLLDRKFIWAIAVLYCVLAFSLWGLRGASVVLGGGDLWNWAAVVFRESKFLAAVLLGGLCVFAARSAWSRPRQGSNNL